MSLDFRQKGPRRKGGPESGDIVLISRSHSIDKPYRFGDSVVGFGVASCQEMHIVSPDYGSLIPSRILKILLRTFYRRQREIHFISRKGAEMPRDVFFAA